MQISLLLVLAATAALPPRARLALLGSELLFAASSAVRFRRHNAPTLLPTSASAGPSAGAAGRRQPARPSRRRHPHTHPHSHPHPHPLEDPTTPQQAQQHLHLQQQQQQAACSFNQRPSPPPPPPPRRFALLAPRRWRWRWRSSPAAPAAAPPCDCSRCTDPRVAAAVPAGRGHPSDGVAAGHAPPAPVWTSQQQQQQHRHQAHLSRPPAGCAKAEDEPALCISPVERPATATATATATAGPPRFLRRALYSTSGGEPAPAAAPRAVQGGGPLDLPGAASPPPPPPSGPCWSNLDADAAARAELLLSKLLDPQEGHLQLLSGGQLLSQWFNGLAGPHQLHLSHVTQLLAYLLLPYNQHNYHNHHNRHNRSNHQVLQAPSQPPTPALPAPVRSPAAASRRARLGARWGLLAWAPYRSCSAPASHGPAGHVPAGALGGSSGSSDSCSGCGDTIASGPLHPGGEVPTAPARQEPVAQRDAAAAAWSPEAPPAAAAAAAAAAAPPAASFPSSAAVTDPAYPDIQALALRLMEALDLPLVEVAEAGGAGDGPQGDAAAGGCFWGPPGGGGGGGSALARRGAGWPGGLLGRLGTRRGASANAATPATSLSATDPAGVATPTPVPFAPFARLRLGRRIGMGLGRGSDAGGQGPDRGSGGGGGVRLLAASADPLVSSYRPLSFYLVTEAVAGFTHLTLVGLMGFRLAGITPGGTAAVYEWRPRAPPGAASATETTPDSAAAAAAGMEAAAMEAAPMEAAAMEAAAALPLGAGAAAPDGCVQHRGEAAHAVFRGGGAGGKGGEAAPVTRGSVSCLGPEVHLGGTTGSGTAEPWAVGRVGVSRGGGEDGGDDGSTSIAVGGSGIDGGAGCGDDVPLVFLHGIGLGLTPYLRLLGRLVAASGGRRPVYAVQYKHVSMRLTTTIPAPHEVATDVADFLAARGVTRMSLLAHSYGTLVASALTKLAAASSAAPAISRLTLVDPVCFAMFLPHLVRNAIYQQPLTHEQGEQGEQQREHQQRGHPFSRRPEPGGCDSTEPSQQPPPQQQQQQQQGAPLPAEEGQDQPLSPGRGSVGGRLASTRRPEPLEPEPASPETLEGWRDGARVPEPGAEGVVVEEQVEAGVEVEVEVSHVAAPDWAAVPAGAGAGARRGAVRQGPVAAVRRRLARSLLRGLVVAEFHCSVALRRRLDWARVNLWPSELPPQCAVVLSGRDNLVPVREVAAILARRAALLGPSGPQPSVLLREDLGHGGFLADDDCQADVMAAALGCTRRTAKEAINATATETTSPQAAAAAAATAAGLGGRGIGLIGFLPVRRGSSGGGTGGVSSGTSAGVGGGGEVSPGGPACRWLALRRMPPPPPCGPAPLPPRPHATPSPAAPDAPPANPRAAGLLGRFGNCSSGREARRAAAPAAGRDNAQALKPDSEPAPGLEPAPDPELQPGPEPESAEEAEEAQRQAAGVRGAGRLARRQLSDGGPGPERSQVAERRRPAHDTPGGGGGGVPFPFPGCLQSRRSRGAAGRWDGGGGSGGGSGGDGSDGSSRPSPVRPLRPSAPVGPWEAAVPLLRGLWRPRAGPGAGPGAGSKASGGGGRRQL
ncbi:hypothetical protein PLESTM_000577500 [Pleodorina starrii]|nr:hypothetical protein PLESTM_000577500 [Pleodorina starrii]